MSRRLLIALVVVGTVVVAPIAFAGKKTSQRDRFRDEYLTKVQAVAVSRGDERATGSLWSDSSPLANLAADQKARAVGDLVTISIMEQTVAQASGTVNTQRSYDAKSGITGIIGRINVRGMDPLIAANSADQLKGQAQTASKSQLRTSVAGQVIAVLANGNLVIEANRDVMVNNERQTVILRGVARPGDISNGNAVLSTQMSNLEIEVRGKGVISDGTRQPNRIFRALMRLLVF